MNRTGILIANGALLVVCCFLAAKIVAAVTAEILTPAPADDAVLAPRPDPIGHGASDPQEILRRNPFNVSTLGPKLPLDDDEVYAKTKLPLRLLGTAASADAERSWAAVEDLDTREHLVVRPNDQLKGQARVIRIDRRRIVLQNGPRREELGLEEGEAAPPPRQSARTPARARRRPAPRNPGRNNPRAEVRQLGENRFAVPRSDVQSIANNPAALFSQARILPKYQDGEMIGVQLNSIKSGSLFEQIGIEDGDTITEFNGIKVTGQQQSAQVLRELTEATKFEVTVDRDGEPVSLSYHLE
jgi:general secretion pathway protein C